MGTSDDKFFCFPGLYALKPGFYDAINWLTSCSPDISALYAWECEWMSFSFSSFVLIYLFSLNEGCTLSANSSKSNTRYEIFFVYLKDVFNSSYIGDAESSNKRAKSGRIEKKTHFVSHCLGSLLDKTTHWNSPVMSSMISCSAFVLSSQELTFSSDFHKSASHWTQLVSIRLSSWVALPLILV